MLAHDLANALLKMPNVEVIITDGYEYLYYHTRGAELSEFTMDDGTLRVDIGVGGCKDE